jgi:hypothetical protein
MVPHQLISNHYPYFGGGYMLTDEKGNDKVKAKIETKEKI